MSQPVALIILPFPPSTNRIWRNVQGRTLLSAEGRHYRTTCLSGAALLRTARFGAARLSVSIKAFQPDARRRDLDNMFKAVLDVLTHAGVYTDDSQIDILSIARYGIDRANPRLEITLETIT